MKIFLIFPTILTAVFARAGSLTPNPFEKIVFSPLYYDQESTFLITTKMNSLDIRIYLSNDMFTDQLIFSEKYSSSGTFTATYDNSYTRSTNRLRVEIIQRKTNLVSNEITMIPANGGYKYIEDNNPITSSSEVYVLSNNREQWTKHNVTYTFENFDGLYIPDYYHKIRLNDFVIHVSDDASFFNCNPTLLITNVDGVFDDIAKTSRVEFPLNQVKTNNGFTFELKDTLYVHKENLMLSKTAKEGYVPTKHIYLPRNSMSEQFKYKATLSIENFGIDHSFARYDFDLKAHRNILGYCSSSEYCITRV